MKGKWNLKDIDVIHTMQILVWYAFRVYKAAMDAETTTTARALYVRDQMNTMIRSLMGKGLICSANMCYDETLWPPTTTEPLQLCEISFSPDTKMGGFALRLDFFKGIKEGVFLASPNGGWQLLDVLNVEYEVEE